MSTKFKIRKMPTRTDLHCKSLKDAQHLSHAVTKIDGYNSQSFHHYWLGVIVPNEILDVTLKQLQLQQCFPR